MEGMLSNYGDGYGYGCGSGYGYGDGYGYGYGDGYGDGYGYGDGGGDGYGCGDGYGYGYGDGEKIAELAGHTVVLHKPFSVVRIGCQCRTIADWRNRWESIASNFEVEVEQQDVDEILAKIQEQTASTKG